MSDLVKIEHPADGIALLRINRPDALNALNTALRHRLTQVFSQMGDDEDVRCIVVTGNEKAFMAGADLNSGHGQAISRNSSSLAFVTV